MGYDADGKRVKKKVVASTKTALVGKLKDLHTDLDNWITALAGSARYSVRQAAQAWLTEGLDGRSPKTIKKNQNVLQLILQAIGHRKLREPAAAAASARATRNARTCATTPAPARGSSA